MMLGMNVFTQNSVLLKNVILSADRFILSTKQSHELHGTNFQLYCDILIIPANFIEDTYIVMLRLIGIDSIFVISNAISIPSQVVHL